MLSYLLTKTSEAYIKILPHLNIGVVYLTSAYVLIITFTNAYILKVTLTSTYDLIVTFTSAYVLILTHLCICTYSTLLVCECYNLVELITHIGMKQFTTDYAILKSVCANYQ